MRLFPPEPVIRPNDGFNEHDIFGYEKFGEQLKDFYASFDDPLVGVLDAPWGSGKSTFIKMWCGYMRNAGYPVIEFDAFKNDYTDDAFLALAGEVALLAEESNGEVSEKRKKFIDKAAGVALAAGKGGLKAFAKKAFTEEGVEELGAAFTGAANGAVDGLESAIKEKLERRKKDKKAFEEFGNTLSALSEQLGKSENVSEKSKPLIFVIDELDRCKPTFALELLEKIKHFFSVPNVHFLLVTNLDQLSKVVTYAYGDGVDSYTYLHKFYNVTFSLPDLGAVSSHRYEVFSTYLGKWSEADLPYDVLTELFRIGNLSLREQLKMHAYTMLQQPQRFTHTGFKYLYIYLAFLRVVDATFFDKVVQKLVSIEEIAERIDSHDFVDTLCRDSLYYAIGKQVKGGPEKDYVTIKNLFANDPLVVKGYFIEYAQKLSVMDVNLLKV